MVVVFVVVGVGSWMGDSGIDIATAVSAIVNGDSGSVESNIANLVCGVWTCGDNTVFGKMGTFVNRTPFGSRGVPGNNDALPLVDEIDDNGGGTMRIGV